eukprot:TRINITY_DN12090_c0_g1_i1.p1 TRINITY_DN12090_c0_g1~~TRINITY_DN12090_c0_g1_i1.p1  ORF type:complete len:320 (+),score=46.77 TRINITY_DN12090_c0_g1_i1:85-960(+)
MSGGAASAPADATATGSSAVDPASILQGMPLPDAAAARQGARDVAMGVLVSGVTGAVIASVAWSRGLRAWRRRHFLDTLNVSINTYDPVKGTFHFRTLHETPLASILPPHGCRVVQSAAEVAAKTNHNLLELPPETEYVVHLRVANLLSSSCAKEWIALDAGSPRVRQVPYVIALTAEPPRPGGQKIRAMVLQRATIAALAKLPPDTPLPPMSGIAGARTDIDAAAYQEKPATLSTVSGSGGGRTRWNLVKLLSRMYCEEAGMTPEELAAAAPERWPTRRRFSNLMLCAHA